MTLLNILPFKGRVEGLLSRPRARGLCENRKPTRMTLTFAGPETIAMPG